ncbi:MAG: hypothetical protein MUC42_17550, partial [Bryobacter sp.]|nr:hypothetical protein [Bryobacter sp.]
PLWTLFFVALGISIFVLPIQVAYGIGSLTTAQELPYRLTGVVHHLMTTFVPLLLLTLAWRGMSGGLKVLQALTAATLFWWSGVRARRIALLVAGTMLAAFLMHPVITMMRQARAITGYSTTESIQLALETSPLAEFDAQRTLLLMAGRFIGYTSYLNSLEQPDLRFDPSLLEPERILALRESGFTRWFTEQVSGYGAGVRGHFSSPGLLGAAHVIGGTTAVLLLPALAGLAIAGGLARLSRRRWNLGALVPANYFVSLLFLIFQEGALDLLFTRLVVLSVSLIVIARLFRAPRPAPARNWAPLNARAVRA